MFDLDGQIVPSILGKLMQDGDRSERVMAALLTMNKLDIEGLRRAYEQQ